MNPVVVGFFLMTEVYLDLNYTCTWRSECQINDVIFFMSMVFNLNEDQICYVLGNMPDYQDLYIFMSYSTLSPTTMIHQYIL